LFVVIKRTTKEGKGEKRNSRTTRGGPERLSLGIGPLRLQTSSNKPQGPERQKREQKKGGGKKEGVGGQNRREEGSARRVGDSDPTRQRQMRSIEQIFGGGGFRHEGALKRSSKKERHGQKKKKTKTKKHGEERKSGTQLEEMGAPEGRSRGEG